MKQMRSIDKGTGDIPSKQILQKFRTGRDAKLSVLGDQNQCLRYSASRSGEICIICFAYILSIIREPVTVMK
jgi:hypothetical protein